MRERCRERCVCVGQRKKSIFPSLSLSPSFFLSPSLSPSLSLSLFLSHTPTHTHTHTHTQMRAHIRFFCSFGCNNQKDESENETCTYFNVMSNKGYIQASFISGNAICTIMQWKHVITFEHLKGYRFLVDLNTGQWSNQIQCTVDCLSKSLWHLNRQNAGRHDIKLYFYYFTITIVILYYYFLLFFI